MIPETKKTKKKRQCRSKSALKTIAMDIVDSKIFTSWMVPEDGPGNVMGMVFMPALFMEVEDREGMIDEGIVKFYEYYDKAAPRSINGLPMFWSMQTLTQVECDILSPLIKRLILQKKEWLSDESFDTKKDD